MLSIGIESLAILEFNAIYSVPPPPNFSPQCKNTIKSIKMRINLESVFFSALYQKDKTQTWASKYACLQRLKQGARNPSQVLEPLGLTFLNSSFPTSFSQYPEEMKGRELFIL